MKNKFNKIELYLLGKLSDAEAKVLEEEAKTDEELARQIKYHRFEMEFVNNMDSKRISEKLKEISQKESAKAKPLIALEPNRYSLFRKIWIPAASIIMIIAGFWLINLFIQSESDVDFALSLYSGDFSNVRKSGNAAEVIRFNSKMTKILETWDKTQAKAAINYFSSFNDPNHPLYLKAQSNLAHSYLLAREYEKAKDSFQALLQVKDTSPAFREETQYFLAIAYLGLENQSEAKKILNSFDKTHRHYYHAQQILSKL